MALKDHPALHTEFKKLQAQKVAILKRSKKWRDRREELLAIIQPLEAELRECKERMFAIERPHVANCDIQMSAIAKATGGIVLIAEGG